MKVALIIEQIEPWRGGAETSTLQFVAHLTRLGCQVSVITLSHAQSTPDMEVVPIRVRTPFRSARTRKFVERATEYARQRGFDIVHSITPCPEADVYQPRGGTVPEMLERNVALRNGPAARTFKRLAQSVNRKYHVIADLERELLTRPNPPITIAISQYVAQQLKRHYGVDGGNVRCIFNGVDPDTVPLEQRRVDRSTIRRQFDLADDDYLVLCIAHNFKLKGVARLVEAAAIHGATPQGAHSHFVVVGRDDPSPYIKLASRLGVANRVMFAGPSKRIGAYFHAADCLAHPTYYDPCSRVVLEALAAGLPAITTRYNGAGEKITDGQEGYVIDSPDDVEALAERITRLSNADHRRECAARAPACVRDATMANHAQGVYDVYQELLQRSGVSLI